MDERAPGTLEADSDLRDGNSFSEGYNPLLAVEGKRGDLAEETGRLPCDAW